MPHLDLGRGQARGKDFCEGLAQLVLPVQLIVGRAAGLCGGQRILSCIVLGACARQQDIRQTLSQHECAAWVSLLQGQMQQLCQSMCIG